MNLESQATSATGLSERIADSYYETTAKRGHSSSKAYYQSAAVGLSRRLSPWLPSNKDARLLDLACGCGEFLFLVEGLGFANGEGVDLCEEEIEQARQYVNAPVSKADVLDYLKAAQAQSFDLITALNLLEHLSKDKMMEVLKECRRVLRPGGALVAMVPNAVSPFGGLTRHWDITHEWAFTTNNFRQLAALVGFENEVEFRECGPLAHGFTSSIRYLLWQLIRGVIATRLLIELGTTKDGIYTMDMLVRMRRAG